MAEPLAVLLLPRRLDGFILRDQADDLLRARGVHALEPPGIPYGVLGRMPPGLARIVARVQARLLKQPGDLRAVVIFHPLQYPLARALLDRHRGAELWYGRWDRYEEAGDAGPRMRERLARLHEAAANDAALTFVASVKLAELEREAGRDAVLVPLAADSFPALDPTAPPATSLPPEAARAAEGASMVAVSLGHLGRRVDWKLLRALAESMPDLALLLVGERHDDECADDEAFAACVNAPNIVWLGRRSDEEAARIILAADVGIVPFKIDPFNDAGLPYRILKYARLGRHTIVPPLAGARTWPDAIETAHNPDEWIAALRRRAGDRDRPDLALRDWALAQTAERQNAPLWERLASLGIRPDDAREQT
jgi:hypothetical protein